MQRDGFAIEAAIERGQPLPDWYLDEPEMEVGDDFYVRAFWDLSTERQLGMAPGPIPYSRIRSYAIDWGLESDMIEPFVDIIRTMDVGWLDWMVKEADKRRASMSGK